MGIYKNITILLLSIFLLTPITYAEEVNLYSARKESLIKPILDIFTEKTGIKVNLVTSKADALLKRLKSEDKNSPADLFITTDVGRLHRAKTLGVLQPTNSIILQKNIPKHLRDIDNHWFGLSQRARTIFYVKNKINPKNLSTYENLADKKWRGKICIRSSSNIYNQSLVASMIANIGDKKTANWVNGLVKNLAKKPSGGDRDQIKAAAAGICDIAIANTYYFAKMMNGKDKKQQEMANKMAVFWPNQKNRGTHINISGIGLTKYAKNKNNAVKLMEFLAGKEAQVWYAKVNYEYPVLKNVKWHKTLQSWGKFKSDTLNLSKLGRLNSQAVRLMDKAEWN